MITLKDYAKKHNISYEAVRKQVNRYRDELEKHLIKQNRTQYIDDEGEAFLDSKRATNPIVIMDHDKDDQIDELQKQNEALKLKIMQLQDQIINRDDKIMELQDKLLLLTAAPEPEKPEDVRPDSDKTDTESDKNEKQPVEQPLDEPEQKRKWWQFWRRS